MMVLGPPRAGRRCARPHAPSHSGGSAICLVDRRAGSTAHTRHAAVVQDSDRAEVPRCPADARPRAVQGRRAPRRSAGGRGSGHGHTPGASAVVVSVAQSRRRSAVRYRPFNGAAAGQVAIDAAGGHGAGDHRRPTTCGACRPVLGVENLWAPRPPSRRSGRQRAVHPAAMIRSFGNGRVVLSTDCRWRHPRRRVVHVPTGESEIVSYVIPVEAVACRSSTTDPFVG
jgi:hypothetical protein